MTKKGINLLILIKILAFFFLTGCAPTPWRAAQNGDLPQLESLINKGHSVDEQSPTGDTALIWAATKGNIGTVRLLIDKGAILNIQNKNGQTALMGAATNGHFDIAKMLIDKGAKLDIQAASGGTALMEASFLHTDIAKLLIDKGAKLDVQSGNGETALMWATAKGNTDLARMLIDKGAKLEIQNKDGQTALMGAAHHGHTDLAKMLIDKGAKLDVQSEAGVTALMLATDKGNADIVRLLIDKGANLNIQNKNGGKALDVAVANKNHTIIDILQTATTGKRPPSQNEPPSSNSPASSVTYTGTGWVTEGGYIVTNYHVIEGQVQLTVRFNSIGSEEYPASVVTSDQHNDLAILKIDTSGKYKPKGIPLASKTPKIGAEVFTVGYPKSGVMGKNPKVTNGIISSLSGIQDDPRIIQTTTAIQSGNSGGPLLTMNGEVVGVTTSTLRAKVTSKGVDVPQGVNYAVKSAYVTALLSSVTLKPSYPMNTVTNAKLEEIIPKIQDSIVQIIAKQ